MRKILLLVLRKIIVLLDILVHRNKIKYALTEEKLQNINKIFDIGANNGEYSILFSKIFPKSKIYAFEPNPYLCYEAKIKTKKYKMITIINCAAGNNNKIVKMKIQRDLPLTNTFSKINHASKTARIKKNFSLENNSEIIQIKMIKINNFINQNSFPDFVKIDVEGYEEEVLKGMIINLKKIKVIMIEFHFDNQYKNYNTARLHNILIKNNFKLFKSIKFPFMKWEDRIYTNLKLSNFNN